MTELSVEIDLPQEWRGKSIKLVLRAKADGTVVGTATAAERGAPLADDGVKPTDSRGAPVVLVGPGGAFRRAWP